MMRHRTWSDTRSFLKVANDECGPIVGGLGTQVVCAVSQILGQVSASGQTLVVTAVRWYTLIDLTICVLILW